MKKFKNRYLFNTIEEFLKNKMVFVGGPRQVGKTTLCTQFLTPKSIRSSSYLNWDDPSSRFKIQNGEFPIDKKILCLDEIHKFKKWRSLIKGLYDTKRYKYKFLITGSARLDYYRKGGDSLLGRYRYVRLHPFSLDEMPSFNKETTEQLLHFGGFPEVLLEGREKNLRLWQRERVFRVINDDIRELNNIKELSLIELLANDLPRRIGSPLSIKSIADDLGVHHATAANWIEILDNLYYSFRISPYGAPKIRAVKKEQKLYLWDWSVIENKGLRFENMLASHLLKFCHFLEDSQGYKMELRFLRDTNKREVDFVVVKNKKPLFAVEGKLGEENISPHIYYFKERINIPVFYQVHLKRKHIEKEKGVIILPFWKFIQELKDIVKSLEKS